MELSSLKNPCDDSSLCSAPGVGSGQSVTTAAPAQATSLATTWPRKFDLLGVEVSATCYQEAEDCIVQAVLQRTSAVVSLHPVHAIMSAHDDPTLRSKVNRFAIVAPDGQPVRWALNRLYRTQLTDRVYGPELMLRLCRRAAAEGIPIFLYGCTDLVLESLSVRLLERFPGLQIAGRYAPPFRPLTPDEDAAVVRQINDSGAGLVFLGLGCPKQDHFAADHAGQIAAVQICVGAAFDFHAGTKRMAPAWMQRRGLEWLFRLSQEPRRLAGRYFSTNSRFVWHLGWRLLRGPRSTAVLSPGSRKEGPR